MNEAEGDKIELECETIGRTGGKLFVYLGDSIKLKCLVLGTRALYSDLWCESGNSVL